MITKKELLDILKDYVTEDYENNLIENALANGRRLEAKELKAEMKSILEAIEREKSIK